MNNKYKLIGIDVDGTLVTNDKKITKETIEILNKCKEIKDKLHLSIVSGRPLSGLVSFFPYFDEDSFFITYNGAKIVNIKTKETIYELNMEEKISKIILNYIYENKLHAFIWINDELYVDEYNKEVKFYEGTSGKKAILINIKELLDSQSKINISLLTKLIIYGNHDTLENVRIELQKLSSDIYCDYSSPDYLEFFNKNVSKGNSLETLARYYSLSMNEVIAIGDNYNDLSMIKKAGLGIAMGNSPDDIKTQANFVTKSNEDNGLVYAINKYIFNIE